MIRAVLFLALLPLLLLVPSSGAQEVTSLKAKLTEKEQTYHVYQERSTQAQEDLARLEGERRIVETTQVTRQQHLDRAQQQLLQKQQLVFTNPGISTEVELQAYASALRAVQEGEQAVARLRQRIAQARRDIEAIQAKLEGITAEREALQRALDHARLERLRQQVEREQEVVVRGEVGCADETIQQCQRRALERARQRAAEEGSAVLVDTMTTVQDLQVTRDEIRTRVKALVLRHQVLEEGFVGRSGYFYQIRAVVKGRIPPELRRHLLDSGPKRVPPSGSAPPKVRRYPLIINVTPANSDIKIMNIQPKYFPGMTLAPGRYDLLVQKEGYEAVRRWVTIQDGDVSLAIRLQKDMRGPPADQPHIPEAPKRVAPPDVVSQPSTEEARLEPETQKPEKPAGRFIQYDNGTALDTRTNLVWMTKDFRLIEGRGPYDWGEAMAWARKMNRQRYGGHRNWRVPTIAEYQTIYDPEKPRQAYHGKAIGYPPVFDNRGGQRFWSSEETGVGMLSSTDIQEYARVLDFTTGAVEEIDRNDFPPDYKSYSVRLVRSVR
ncbi:MAG: DUF1566 domain-containing protein [Candidatus Tectomicrobia bacterium]|nr:DUF1566 domain-containing protein [Candidatus Tectomicrobia bacterium]